MTDNPRHVGPFSDATSVTFGVTTARMASNHPGAQLLIERYLEDARAEGVEDSQAWAMLYSSAIVALADQVAARAREQGVSPMSLLADTAVAHAAAKVVT